jgi:serum/glucocorticoid-regulated kinase 2
MDPTLDDARDLVTDSERERTEDERTDDPSSTETPSGSTAGSNTRKVATDVHIVQEDERDVFDGYSFKGRQSVIIGEDEFEDNVTNTGHERVDEVVHLGSDAEAADEASSLHTDREREIGDDISEVSIKPYVIPTHRPPLEELPASKPPSVHDVKISNTIPETIAEKEEVDPGISALFTASEMFLALQTPLPPSPLQLPPEIPPAQEEKAPAPVAPIETKKAAVIPEPLVPVVEAPKVPTKPPPPSRQLPTPVLKPTARSRREKSGIPALDRFIESEDQEEAPEPAPDTRSEDEDWDFIEKDGGEDVNGPKPGSLWSRGVVDRYKLAVVFRKSSTPAQRSRTRLRPGASGTSSRSDVPAVGSPNSQTSPSPSDSKRRGRTAGLSIRKSTRQFLRAKSPISFSSSPTPKRPFLGSSNSPAQSVRQVSLSTLAPTTNSRSVSGTGTTIDIGPPSLRSKASDLSNTNPNATTNSLGSPSSSHPSLEAAGATSPEDSPPQMASLLHSASEIVVGAGSKEATVRGFKPSEGEHGDKRNFSEKMKVGAEKVKSLFTAGSSQKQQQQQQQSPPPPTPSS